MILQLKLEKNILRVDHHNVEIDQIIVELRLKQGFLFRYFRVTRKFQILSKKYCCWHWQGIFLSHSNLKGTVPRKVCEIRLVCGLGC
jgi:hypothetical protein